MIVLMYQTRQLGVTDAFVLLAVCGAGGVLARVIGSLLSAQATAMVSRYHNLAMLIVAAAGFVGVVYQQTHMGILVLALLLSGYPAIIYGRAFDSSLVGTRSDLTGTSLPSAWVVGIILISTFLAYLLVPLVVMLPLPIEGAAKTFVMSSGNLFSRQPIGAAITPASFPLLMAVLFLASSIKQWLLPNTHFPFKPINRVPLRGLLLNNKHLWYVGILYNMTLGSFIGFSFVLPIILEVEFGYSTLMLVWMAPFLGILARPLGHWLGRLFGGTLVTQVCLLLMSVFAAMAARQFLLMDYPQDMRYFDVLFISMMGLVISSAMANGSVVVTLHKVFPLAYVNRVLSWVGSVAFIGAVYLPLRFLLAWEEQGFANVMFEIVVFFVLGFIANYIIYLRRHGEFYNP